MQGSRRSHEIAVPMLRLPPTRVFAHTTRMADFDSPATEEILLPALEHPAHTRTLEVADGRTSTHAELWPRPDGALARLKHLAKERLHRRAPIETVAEGLVYDARYFFLGNIAHLVHCLLPILCLAEETLAKQGGAAEGPIQVLVPAQPPALATRFLDAAGIPWIATDGAVDGRILRLSDGHDLSILDRLVRLPCLPPDAGTPRRIYVARRGERVVLNEDALLPLLEGYGFERIFLEDHPLERQWALLGHARDVVGIHGAGLANLAFCLGRPRDESPTGAPRFRLVELFSPGFANNCFRQYAAALGGTWTGVRGRITPEIVRDLDVRGDTRAHAMASFEVDLAAVEAALDHAEITPAG